jgi:hypothetical protein
VHPAEKEVAPRVEHLDQVDERHVVRTRPVPERRHQPRVDQEDATHVGGHGAALEVDLSRRPPGEVRRSHAGRLRRESTPHQRHLFGIRDALEALPADHQRLRLLGGDDEVDAPPPALRQERPHVLEEDPGRPLGHPLVEGPGRRRMDRTEQVPEEVERQDVAPEHRPPPPVLRLEEGRAAVVHPLVERHDVRREGQPLGEEHRHDDGGRRVRDGEVDHLEPRPATRPPVQDLLQQVGIGLVVGVVIAERRRSPERQHAERAGRLRHGEVPAPEAVVVDAHGEQLARADPARRLGLVREVLGVAPDLVAVHLDGPAAHHGLDPPVPRGPVEEHPRADPGGEVDAHAGLDGEEGGDDEGECEHDARGPHGGHAAAVRS